MIRTKFIAFAGVAMSTLTTGAIMPILAPLIRSLNLSIQQGGLMLSVSSLAMAACAGPWGAASDRWGRAQVLLVGFAGMSLSYLLFAAVVQEGLSGGIAGTPLLLLLIAGRAAIIGFLAAIPAAAQALMADQTQESERASGMAIISAGNGLGLVLGPALGGLLATAGIVWPLLASAMLCLAGFALVSRGLPRGAPHPAAKLTPSAQRFPAALLPWLAASLVSWIAVVTMQVVPGFYFQDRLGLSTAQVSPWLAAALTLTGLALFGTQLLQARLLRWTPRRMIIVGSGLWTTGLLVLLGTATIGTYLAAFAVIGAAAGFMMAGSMAGASLAMASGRQGTIAGLTAVTLGIAMFAAPVAATALYELHRLLPFACLIAIVCCVGAIAASRPLPNK